MRSRPWSDVRAAAKRADLQVLSQDLDDAPAPARISLRCHCPSGRVFEASKGNILSGNTTSCGCSKRRHTWDDVLSAADAAGIVLLNVPEDRSCAPHVLLDALCVPGCRKPFRPQYVHLITGKSRSCGCSIQKLTWDRVEAGAQSKGLKLASKGSGFISSSIKVDLICVCDERFKSRASHVAEGLISSCGCRQGRRFTPEKLAEAASKFGLRVQIPEALKSNTLVPTSCGACGGEFLPMAHNLVAGRSRSCGCVRSHAQKDLTALLVSMGEKVESEYPLEGMKCDIYLPERRLVIEYDGLRWHGEGGDDPTRAKATMRRWRACQKAGLRLVNIFEDEWIYRKGAVVSRLKAILGRSEHTVGARKCHIRHERSPEITKLFHDHHLQGPSGGEPVTLYDAQGPVAAAIFAHPNASRGNASAEGRWELMRFVVRGGWSVPGAFSRLLKAFVEKTDPREIVSYSDNRWSEGDVYRRAGFVDTGLTPPSCWYFKADQYQPRRIHRFGVRKTVLLKQFGGDPRLTGWQLAQAAGYNRVWDLGCRRWLWTRSVVTR